jgi:hypothetical protein
VTAATDTACQLAALLRLLEKHHQDLSDIEAQSALAWLLPLAARLAEDVVAMLDEPPVEG